MSKPIPLNKLDEVEFISPANSACQGCAGSIVARIVAKVIGKEMVRAVPLPPVVQRDGEEVGSLQAVECCLAILSACHGVAQRTAQAVQDRRLQQEGLDM